MIETSPVTKPCHCQNFKILVRQTYLKPLHNTRARVISLWGWNWKATAATDFQTELPNPFPMPGHTFNCASIAVAVEKVV